MFVCMYIVWWTVYLDVALLKEVIESTTTVTVNNATEVTAHVESIEGDNVQGQFYNKILITIITVYNIMNTNNINK